jgi:PII-like signaling protein
MGFGVHRQIHRKGLFGISDGKPNIIVVVENEQKLRAVLPIVRPMIREGLLVLLDAELIP